MEVLAAYLAFVVNLVSSLPLDEVETATPPYKVENEVVLAKDDNRWLQGQTWIMILFGLLVIGGIIFAFWWFFVKGKHNL